MTGKKDCRGTVEERFEAKTIPVTETGCLLWTGCWNHFGHGQFAFNGRKLMVASRAAWVLAGRTIPEGMFILHKCDTPQCVNVDHLFVGTKKDNTQDMIKKGRLRISGVAKITLDQANIIRGMEGVHKKIAEAFGINQSQVSRIKSGLSWHLPAFRSKQ